MRTLTGLICLLTACSAGVQIDADGRNSYFVTLPGKPGKAWMWRVYPPEGLDEPVVVESISIVGDVDELELIGAFVATGGDRRPQPRGSPIPLQAL